MNRERKDELDRLLARGRMSRPEKERLLDEVLARSTDRPISFWERLRRSQLRFALPVLALVLLAPLVLLRRADDGFRAKGVRASTTLEVGCADACRAGGLLLFRTAHVQSPGRLSAFAEDGAGRRVWYFPTDTGEQPMVDAHEGPAALARGVRIGPEHRPGAYRVTLLLTPLSEGPLTRDEVLRRANAESTQPRLGLASQPLEIAP